MLGTPLKRLALAASVLTVTAASLLAVAPTALAAAPVYSADGRTLVGDLTGDGVADRVSVGTYSTPGHPGCGYRIEPGLGSGRYGPAVTGRLPVRNTVPDDGFFTCPSYPTLLKGPTPDRNRLAVTWSDFGPYGDDAPSVQTFGGFGGTVRYTGGFDGQFQTGRMASQDFDGDGWGDVWETTDQGAGFEAFVGRGNAWHRLYGTPLTFAGSPQFLDLNHAGGTDILVSWDGFGDAPGVAAVDGRTGAQQVLVQDTTGDVTLSPSVVDIDHDAFLDLQVVEQDLSGATVAVHRFVNRSQGGRWFFAEVTPSRQ